MVWRGRRYRGTQARRRSPAAERSLFGGGAEAGPHGQLGNRLREPEADPLVRRAPPAVRVRPGRWHAVLRDWMQRIHPEDRAMTRQIIERSSREQTEFQMDYRVRHPDGS